MSILTLIAILAMKRLNLYYRLDTIMFYHQPIAKMGIIMPIVHLNNGKACC